MDQQFNFHARICGKLLGDGCMTKQGNRKPRSCLPVHNTTQEQFRIVPELCYAQVRVLYRSH